MSEHVLVVADDSACRGLLREVLTEDGFAVKTAATGEEALAQVARDPPSVLLLDVELPQLDGWAVLRMAGYLAKPFDLDDLVHHVERFTQRRSPA